MQWDEYFIGQLVGIAAKSDDPSSKFGALISDEHNVIVSTGYNGTPRFTDIEFKDRATKYLFTVHAEMNSICNAALTGRSTNQCHLYLIRPPCLDCAKHIIQAGITQVICAEHHPHYPDSQERPWTWYLQDAVSLLMSAGTHVRVL